MINLEELPDIISRATRILVDESKVSFTAPNIIHVASGYPMNRHYRFKISLFYDNKCCNIYVSENMLTYPVIIEPLTFNNDNIIRGKSILMEKDIMEDMNQIKHALLLIEDMIKQPLPIEIWEFQD